MKIYRLVLIAILVITAASCESSDESLDVEELESSTELSNLQIMSYTEDFFQIDVQNGEVTYNNLSQTLEVTNQFKYVNYDSPSLEIFSGRGDDFSLYQSNLETKASNVIKGFCADEQDIRPRYGLIHNDRYFLLNEKYIGDSEKFELYLNQYAEGETDCSQFLLSESYHHGIEVVKQDQFLIIYYVDSQFKDRLLIYNLDTFKIIIDKQFLSSIYAICKVNEIEIVSIGDIATVYKYEDFSEVSTRSFYGGAFSNKPLIKNSETFNNKIVINRNSLGPSNFSSRPVILDLNTGELVDIEFDLLTNIQYNLRINKSYPVTLHSSRFDLKREKIAIGYQVQDKEEYGVMWFDYNGEIVQDIPLELLPQIIFLD